VFVVKICHKKEKITW
jgi:hypothetical protein